MFQIIRSSPVYDVVIIGSGAGGGTATKVLTDMGISVALLEAGGMINPAKDFKEHMWPWQVPHRQLYHDVACRICYSRICPYGHECLRLVSPEQVVCAAEELLADAAAQRERGGVVSIETAAAHLQTEVGR